MKKSSFLLVILLSTTLFLPQSAKAFTIGRLGIRSTTTVNEFYDTSTNQTVLLRGNNYQRLATYTLANGTTYTYHSNFDAAHYDRTRAIAAMDLMKTYGYNAIRVFTNQYQTGNQSGGTGLEASYFTNLADYVNLAKAHGMYVNIVFSLLPSSGGYIPSTIDPNIDPTNTYHRYILIKSFVDAKVRYMQDAMNLLKTDGAPMDTILWSIENEPYFYSNLKPFSLTTGKITIADGLTYDMSLAMDKNRLIDDSLVYYANTVRGGMKQIDPNALIGITVFSAAEVAAQPTWLIRTGSLINNSTLDFIGINSYPVPNTDMSAKVDSLQIGTSKKVLMQTEFGAYPNLYSTIQLGATGLVNYQVLTCSKYNYRGWFTYDWDTTDAEYAPINFNIYHAVQSGGVIANALAPFYRLDPCLVASNPPPPIPGDVNGDHYVDINDFNLIKTNFGNPYTIFDFNNLVTNYGK